MARLSDNRIAWTYTADDGSVYRVAAVKAYTDQAKQGGSDGSGESVPRPAGFKMRRISVRSAAGATRVIPVYEPGAAICVAGETINLNVGSDSATFTSQGNPIPEQHIIKNVTHQNT